MNDMNPNSEEIYANAMMETGLEEIRRRAPWPEEEGEKDLGKEDRYETVRSQGLKVGYQWTRIQWRGRWYSIGFSA